MNECPPDFLDQYAGLMDFFAEKNTGIKTDKGADKSAFDRRSAARARLSSGGGAATRASPNGAGFRRFAATNASARAINSISVS